MVEFWIHTPQITSSKPNRGNFSALLAFVVICHIRNIMKWSMKWPNGNFLSRHTFFLWPYMVSCGALQWSLNIRWCWCTAMCHWLHDITLSSNAAEILLEKTLIQTLSILSTLYYLWKTPKYVWLILLIKEISSEIHTSYWIVYVTSSFSVE